MKKYMLSLFLVLLLLSINSYAVKVAVLPEMNRPDNFVVDGDDIIINDYISFNIIVYSLKTSELKFQIGKRGQGPGEYPHFPRLNAVRPDSIWCSSGSKLLVYTREGKLVKEKVFPRFTKIRVTPIKNNYIAMNIHTNIKTRVTMKDLDLLDPEFEKIKDVYEVQSDSNFMTRNDTGNEEFRLLFHVFDFIPYDGKLFIVDSKKGFFIDVYGDNGNHLYSIDKKIVEPVKVTKEQKEKMLEELYNSYKYITQHKKKSAFTFYEYYPPIRQVCIDSDKIYVTTYKEVDGKNEMIILDIKGNLLRKILLPIKSTKLYKMIAEYDNFTVHKGMLYELIENEKTGNWELFKTDLSTIK